MALISWSQRRRRRGDEGSTSNAEGAEVITGGLVRRGSPLTTPYATYMTHLERPDLSQFARSDQPVEPRCTDICSRLTLTAAGSASGSLVVGTGISYPSVPHHAVAHVH